MYMNGEKENAGQSETGTIMREKNGEIRVACTSRALRAARGAGGAWAFWRPWPSSLQHVDVRYSSPHPSYRPAAAAGGDDHGACGCGGRSNSQTTHSTTTTTKDERAPWAACWMVAS